MSRRGAGALYHAQCERRKAAEEGACITPPPSPPCKKSKWHDTRHSYDGLASDVLALVCTFLDAIPTLIRMRGVSREWSRVSQLPRSWSHAHAAIDPDRSDDSEYRPAFFAGMPHLTSLQTDYFWAKEEEGEALTQRLQRITTSNPANLASLLESMSHRDCLRNIEVSPTGASELLIDAIQMYEIPLELFIYPQQEWCEFFHACAFSDGSRCLSGRLSNSLRVLHLHIDRADCHQGRYDNLMASTEKLDHFALLEELHIILAPEPKHMQRGYRRSTRVTSESPRQRSFDMCERITRLPALRVLKLDYPDGIENGHIVRLLNSRPVFTQRLEYLSCVGVQCNSAFRRIASKCTGLLGLELKFQGNAGAISNITAKEWWMKNVTEAAASELPTTGTDTDAMMDTHDDDPMSIDVLFFSILAAPESFRHRLLSLRIFASWCQTPKSCMAQVRARYPSLLDCDIHGHAMRCSADGGNRMASHRSRMMNDADADERMSQKSETIEFLLAAGPPDGFDANVTDEEEREGEEEHTASSSPSDQPRGLPKLTYRYDAALVELYAEDALRKYARVTTRLTITHCLNQWKREYAVSQRLQPRLTSMSLHSIIGWKDEGEDEGDNQDDASEDLSE